MPFQVSAPSGPAPFRLDAARRIAGEGWILRVFGLPAYRIPKDIHLVPAVESLLCHWFARMQTSQLVLHTGMVVWNGRGLLIPGDRGSGKSTLTLALARAGAQYFGDDLITFDPAREIFRAFPKAVTLKHGSFACFEEVATHEDPIRGPIRYFLPESAGLHELPISGLRAIVFPEYSRAGGEPRPLSAGWTALALVQQLLGGLEWNDQALALVARLGNVPGHALPYRDLGAAVEFIRGLVEAGDAR